MGVIAWPLLDGLNKDAEIGGRPSASHGVGGCEGFGKG